MLTDIQITTYCTNPIKPVDVMFVGFTEIPLPLRERMGRNCYRWDRISWEEFLATFKLRRIEGTVILDATDTSAAYNQGIDHILKSLDSKNIPAICLNLPAEVDITSLKLTVSIDSMDWNELWGRIESNRQFYHHLQESNPHSHKVRDNQELAEDTAQQLEMAAKVQRNFLPSRMPNTDKIQWAAMFSPAQWVSGDIYDIARLDENHIGFYLADAVGHSMPAALLTMFLKQATVMRKTIDNDYYIFKPWEVISTLNLRMAEQELAGCLFATCFYGLLNIETLELEYARAGHPYPILIRDGQLQQLTTRGGLLGVFAEATFEQQSLKLIEGDKLFVYSDGGEPLIGDTQEDGTFEYTDRFIEICKLPIEDMIAAYAAMAADFHFKPGEIDDVSAIGLEIQ